MIVIWYYKYQEKYKFFWLIKIITFFKEILFNNIPIKIMNNSSNNLLESYIPIKIFKNKINVIFFFSILCI